MIVTIEKSKAFGSVEAPPSKSIAHRLLICGAMSEGSEIRGVQFSEDIKATIGALKTLGADVKINGDTVILGGLLSNTSKITEEAYCNESGSTLRFLLPFGMIKNEKVKFTGTERLFQRSLSVYEELCKEQGIEFESEVNSVTVNGKLGAGKYTVRGDVSSQFISGLLFVLPTLRSDSTIEITGKLESAPYLLMTVSVLAGFGVRICRTDEKTLFIKGGQTYKKRKLSVEGDYSNAAFFEALNVLGGNVSVSGLIDTSVQGDRVYKKIFELLKKGTPTVDISDCPDLAPVIMAVAAACGGATLTGTHRLKIKESDRGAAMAEELAKFGCKTVIESNSITVKKCELKTPALPLSGHNDHRIVMADAVLATVTGGSIYGAESVNKSFPDFFEKLQNLGIKLRVENI